ncbi:hypothetical protein QUF73_13200 [Cytobacillus sp. NJ13]|nr:hypothetical protein [Cytobacillus sp. NJ13]
MVLIRTGKEENRAVLSEPDATSDRRSGNPRGVVRTWSYFGQEEEKSAWCCPNLMQVRTGGMEIRVVLSELGATSDRRSGNPRGVVRTWSNFGQKEEKSAWWSPNLEQLRTGGGEICAVLSELGATSDRKWRNPRGVVRTWGWFGQEKEKFAR